MSPVLSCVGILPYFARAGMLIRSLFCINKEEDCKMLVRFNTILFRVN